MMHFIICTEKMDWKCILNMFIIWKKILKIHVQNRCWKKSTSENLNKLATGHTEWVRTGENMPLRKRTQARVVRSLHVCLRACGGVQARLMRAENACKHYWKCLACTACPLCQHARVRVHAAHVPLQASVGAHSVDCNLLNNTSFVMLRHARWALCLLRWFWFLFSDRIKIDLGLAISDDAISMFRDAIYPCLEMLTPYICWQQTMMSC